MFKTACIIASVASISAMQLNAGHPGNNGGKCWAIGSENEAHCEQTPAKGKKWCQSEVNHTKCNWEPYVASSEPK